MNLQTHVQPPLDDHESVKLTLAALSSFELAFAVLDKNTSLVIFLSDGFREILPSLQLGDCWELLSQCNATTEPAKHCREMDLSGRRYSVRTKALASGYCLVSLSSSKSVRDNLPDNLHDYMQARDSLFSTFRTISVSEMATTLAHEINTPVGTITNILSGIKLRLQKPDTSAQVLDDALNKALEQTQYTQSVINRIREFTQSRRPKHTVLDIRTLVREAVSLLDWMLSKHHCEVKSEFPETPVLIDGDATMLQQVLINLLRNAIDAMDNKRVDQRVIRICIKQVGQIVTVSISDTGSGLESACEKLFVPFATNKADGMGVGLNICRSFLELHRGKLWLKDNRAQGCTSYIELPLAEQEHNELEESGADG